MEIKDSSLETSIEHAVMLVVEKLRVWCSGWTLCSQVDNSALDEHAVSIIRAVLVSTQKSTV